MRRVVLASAGVVMAAWMGAASAADLPRRTEMPARAPAYLTTMYNWTGLYFGINAGGAWGNSTWTAPGFSTGEFDLSGALIGGTLGYNWQSGQAVFGIETDVAWSNIDGTTGTFCPGGCQTSNNWLGTTRGRLGFAVDRFMPYLTAGAAYGDINARFAGLPEQTETNIGWTAGAGAEFALAGNWTAKAEYLYVDLGDMSCGAAGCGVPAPTNVDFTAHVVRGGFNFRF